MSGSGFDRAGIPEAPSNGSVYARRNMEWTPALPQMSPIIEGSPQVRGAVPEFQIFGANDSNSVLPSFRFLRTRGTVGAPTDVENGTRIGGLVFSPRNAGGFRNNVAFEADIYAPVTATLAPCRFTVSIAGANDSARSQVLGIIHNGQTYLASSTGFIQDDARLTVNGGVRLHTGGIKVGQYTVATVPSVSAYSGYQIYVTNATGGASPAFSNGTNWISLLTGNPI